ncbi:hypothetical protein AUEXF2481DRAFT_283001 [Aureobasidium subglaciale EXF-2481]|uniref:Uncharacterized protein n=1 Tax=Aureobasidium subglaciale (strain EXF-2481) TaxID=1043005 RepID=A0A074YEQ2_AURSE|nr:uncharacterized protein AUEXF2481DRAFT_283001 [Aureobasidium subglaciale EXF-2481]KEQ94534.1 hypothetical protein AUEXF2481DRAFT_283001 [Aureobasidium subglaciale EXF-2481]
MHLETGTNEVLDSSSSRIGVASQCRMPLDIVSNEITGSSQHSGSLVIGTTQYLPWASLMLSVEYYLAGAHAFLRQGSIVPSSVELAVEGHETGKIRRASSMRLTHVLHTRWAAVPLCYLLQDHPVTWCARPSSINLLVCCMHFGRGKVEHHVVEHMRYSPNSPLTLTPDQFCLLELLGL